MRLFIGKNHQSGTSSVRSVFRLAGNDEDALTFALGYLLAQDPVFCGQLMRQFRIASPEALSAGYAVHLQEVTNPGYGRRDIVVETDAMRVVFEAKIGGSEPTADQLLKYADELKLWESHKERVLVALTQVKLSETIETHIRASLSRQRIKFRRIQWHELIDLVLRYRPSGDSTANGFLFDEFIRYVRSDYQMGYYDAEIAIQDVNQLNAKIYKECWMYVTRPNDKKAPLYFAPYFTKQNKHPGLSMISRVLDIENMRLVDKHVEDVQDSNAPRDEHVERWRDGVARLRKRAEKEGFFDKKVRLFYLDRPIKFMQAPLTKEAYNAKDPPKKIPNQIPKGFSLTFDELLAVGTEESSKYTRES